MDMKVFQVDAFTRQPFTGNPAGVCLLDRVVTSEWMQAFAAEMNLSETAFLLREGGDFGLRWFTPVCEVDLCGHATLASAHVLWESNSLDRTEEARFHTRSGLLVARFADTGIEMDFPSEPAEEAEPPGGLLEALGVSAGFVGKNREHYLIDVGSEAAVREVNPDFARLKKVSARGVIVTAISSSAPFDFVSRFFAPAFGINEDPVTGSAHCCLGPYWSHRLGKEELVGFQASFRGGEVGVRMRGDRVILVGRAVTVLSCRLMPAAAPVEGGDEKAFYEKGMEEQFHRMASQIDRFMGRLEGDARSGYDRLVAQVREKQKVVDARLKELKASGSETWQDLRPGLEGAWHDLKDAFEKISSRFHR